MNTVSRAHLPAVTIVRWVARLGGLLYIVVVVVTDTLVIAEMVGGAGPNWATLSAGEWANAVLALALPLVAIVGVVIAWLRTGAEEGIGGALVVVAALVAMGSNLAGPSGGGVSMALSALPMALVGAGFLYCWWVMRRVHPQQVA